SAKRKRNAVSKRLISTSATRRQIIPSPPADDPQPSNARQICHKKAQESQGEEMNEQEIFALCDRIHETSFALHQYLRHGHLAKVYENGLRHRLAKIGIVAIPQFELKVQDEDGTIL